MSNTHSQRAHGISHRAFLKYGATLTLLLALLMSALTLDKAAAEAPKKETPSSAARGQVVFNDNCSDCHSAKPVPFRTAPKLIPQRLRDPRILVHQFQLSDRQIEDLVNYLKELAKRR